MCGIRRGWFIILSVFVGAALGQEIQDTRPGSWRDHRASRNRDGQDASSGTSEWHGRRQHDQRSSRDSGQQSSWGRSRSGFGLNNPQDRERFYGQMVDHYIERMGRRYEMDETQIAQARSRLNEIKQEQIAYSQQHSQEYQSLHDESHRLRDAARAGSPIDKQKAKEVESRYHALRDNAPLMNSKRIEQEVQKLLPPEQVQRGVSRHESEHAERRRSRDHESQNEQRIRPERQPRENLQVPATPMPPDGGRAGQLSARVVADNALRLDKAGKDARQRYHESRHRGHESQQSPSQVSDPQVAALNPSSTVQAGDERRHPRGHTMREDPISPWEQYVRDFIQLYSLDPAQQATAWSILREMQERRTAYEQSHKYDYEKAGQIEDSTLRAKRIEEINLPVVRSFEELKMRLMRIPSSAQRQAAGGSVLTTQPATSRPS